METQEHKKVIIGYRVCKVWDNMVCKEKGLVAWGHIGHKHVRHKARKAREHVKNEACEAREHVGHEAHVAQEHISARHGGHGAQGI